MSERLDEAGAVTEDEPSGIVATRGDAMRSHRRAPEPRRTGGPSRRWMAGFLSILVVVLVLGAGLAYVGLSTVRTSRAGRVVSTITDPAAPGFEALVEPSPTLVVFDERPEHGTLRTVTVLSLNSGDMGGAVFVLPAATLAGTGKEAGSISSVYAYAPHPEDARSAVQEAVTMGIAETTIVDDTRWAELVAPVAPLTIENPRAFGPFAEGTISLAADQVGAWLDASNEGDTQVDTVRRQALLWTAWIDAVRASTDPAVVPGEVDSGIGRFVRGMAKEPTRLEEIPVDPKADVLGNVRYVPDVDAARGLVNELVPFPSGSLENPRVRVRVLDGTGNQDHVRQVAPRLIPADAEVVVAGNAKRFDYTTTEIRYHDPLVKQQAAKLQQALGAGKVVEDPRPTEAFDVTIILGSDV